MAGTEAESASCAQVPDIASIQAHLRDMPEAEKSRKLRRMKALRLVMTYSVRPGCCEMCLRLDPIWAPLCMLSSCVEALRLVMTGCMRARTKHPALGLTP